MTATATKPDAVCAAAVEPARQALLDAGVLAVGEHLGVTGEGERCVTHSFACVDAGYQGWRWAVTVVRAPRAKTATVAESVLLPGEDALLAPTWIPWSDRLQPGDLGVGDLLPTSLDDPRLVPGFTGADDEEMTDPDQVRDVVFELGLGRPRILSLDGLLDAADRWVNGVGGPAAPIAQAAPARCESCGFLIRINGLLGQGFGLCGNEYSPSDGVVVALDHGCGAHSEARGSGPDVAITATVVDDFGYDDLGHA
jgi:Protein of unknown function (DUF3027)